jgi:hypothetical protein
MLDVLNRAQVDPPSPFYKCRAMAGIAKKRSPPHVLADGCFKEDANPHPADDRVLDAFWGQVPEKEELRICLKAGI